MREARPDTLEFLDQLRRDLGDALHVAAVARMQNAARDAVTFLPAVRDHLRPAPQHFRGHP